MYEIYIYLCWIICHGVTHECLPARSNLSHKTKLEIGRWLKLGLNTSLKVDEGPQCSPLAWRTGS